MTRPCEFRNISRPVCFSYFRYYLDFRILFRVCAVRTEPRQAVAQVTRRVKCRPSGESSPRIPFLSSGRSRSGPTGETDPSHYRNRSTSTSPTSPAKAVGAICFTRPWGSPCDPRLGPPESLRPESCFSALGELVRPNRPAPPLLGLAPDGVRSGGTKAAGLSGHPAPSWASK